MKYFILLTLCSLSFNSLIAQNIERIEVLGLILADTNDVENITVYNTSSNKGTITNNKGEFTLKVILNDIIEVSAIQFNPVLVTITKEVINTKQLKIYLTEHINQLDAVLLSDGLSGNLVTDIDNAEALPKLDFNMGNMNALEFFDDNAFNNEVIKHELNKVMNKGGLYNGINLGALFDLISSDLFKFKKRTRDKNKGVKDEKSIEILDIYSHATISDICNIPLSKVELFIAFIEAKGIKDNLYKPENEVYLIEFLINQSKAFLKLNDAKD